MKVLYIGCYRDGTGWANAAQGYILALDSAGVDVVPRFIKLNKRSVDIPHRISELETKDCSDCDIVIQHVLPHHLCYDGHFSKNISLYVTETTHCRNSAWPERINLMDEAWVPNKFMADFGAKNSRIEIPHYVVPHSFDMSKYQQEFKPLDIDYIKDKFVFYYIGEISKRKNITDLLKAFHLEFSPNEDVAIIIKAHHPTKTAEESKEYLSNISRGVKEGLKLYRNTDMYHKEVFICDYLSEEQINRVHSTGDCFVSATYGEAWGIPVFEAMAMGKTPICTDTGGPRDFIGNGGYLVESSEEPCFGMVETFDEIYVGNENWDKININKLRESMRRAYSEKEDRESRAAKGVENSYEYSYRSVGEKMKSILLGESKSEEFSSGTGAKVRGLL